MLAVGVYTALVTWAALKITGLCTNGIRVSPEDESQGLDISLHEEAGYKL